MQGKDRFWHKKEKNGFTLVEIVIVVAILSVILAFAAAGISGYINSSEQMRRTEVAETAFYSLQSHINYLKRHDALQSFEDQLKSYNLAMTGSDRVMTEPQNRTIIVSNYEEGDAAAFYNEEYYPAHENSEIIYVALDSLNAVGTAREMNPFYDVLASAIGDASVMENSFLVEYDLSTGMVRSVFYSEDADNLGMAFADPEGTKHDQGDCIWRDSKALSKKKQGYYGVVFTSHAYEEVVNSVDVPDKVEIVNGDRLYLTWAETNANNQSFIDGTYRMEALYYTIHLYDQNDVEIAAYEVPRAEMYEDISGTQEGVLNSLDDYDVLNGKQIVVEDTLDGSTKTARIGYADLAYEEAPDNVSGEYYYMLLECPDHPFGDNGYAFEGADTIYAILELAYGENGAGNGELSQRSNTESVYYAYVKNTDGDTEYGIACSRHLWNVRNGFADGDYRLVADIDWTDIEGRGRAITYTAIMFADKGVPGSVLNFMGTFTGEKTEELLGDVFLDSHEIHGIKQSEDVSAVGLFATNEGLIEKVVLTDYEVSGVGDVGTLAGMNLGTIRDVWVQNATVTAEYQAGGLVGNNSGSIDGVAVTGAGRISAQYAVGGVAGVSSGSVSNAAAACRVESYVPENTQKLTGSKVGRYVGGVIGQAKAGSSAQMLFSGIYLNTEKVPGHMEHLQNSGVAVSDVVASSVTGIGEIGGVIGTLEQGAGTYEKLYNYADLQVIYIPTEGTYGRKARGDNNTGNSFIYQYYGGITGRLLSGDTLLACENFTPVKVTFVERADEESDYTPVAVETVYNYILRVNNAGGYNAQINQPQYIGGIVGLSDGTVQDCLSACADYGPFEEELSKQLVRLEHQQETYVGWYVGGLVGFNREGVVLFTPSLGRQEMKVSVQAYITAGGLVGWQEKVSAAVRNETGSPIVVKGVVAAEQDYAGGVAGSLHIGEITGAYSNECNVFGEMSAGIVACLGGTTQKNLVLKDCTNSGTIIGRGFGAKGALCGVGGIAGISYGTLENCSNTGTISAYYDAGIPSVVDNRGVVDMGGVVGYNAGTVKNCHSMLNADESNFLANKHYGNLGGLVGHNMNNGNTLLGVIVNERKEEEIAVPLFVGEDTNSNANSPTKVGGIVGYPEGSGAITLQNYTYSGSISFSSKAGMNGQENGTGGIAGYWLANQTMSGCKMKGSIVSVNTRNGGLVGYMKGGVIDGTNQVLEGASVMGTDHTGGVIGTHTANRAESRMDVLENHATVIGGTGVGGIFGYVSNGFYVSLDNRVNYGDVTGTGNYVGGLAGRYMAAVTGAPDGTEGIVNGIENATNYGIIKGVSYTGGLVGDLYTNTTAHVYHVKNCSNQGDIYQCKSGTSYYGGLIGHSIWEAVVEDCTNTGAILPADTAYITDAVGGLVGYEENNISFYRCANHGTLYGRRWVAGMAGYVIKASGSVKAIDCINGKGADMVATMAYCGGMFGSIRLDNMGETVALELRGCSNAGQMDAPEQLGGLVGRIERAHFEITDCHNTGDIGFTGNWKITNAGGMVGIYQTLATTSESLISGCTSEANISHLTASGNNGLTGGIIGQSLAALRIEHCTNGSKSKTYLISAEGNTGKSGGILGASLSASVPTTIIDCVNYADFYAGGSVDHVGGIMGVGYGTTIMIGEQGVPETYCYNYGNLDCGNVGYYFGGILGSGEAKELGIYGAENYGLIGEKTAYIYSTGGLVGRLSVANANSFLVTMEDCVQHGTIYHATQMVGGLIGRMANVKLVMDHCRNGVESGEEGRLYAIDGSVTSYLAGIIGYCDMNLNVNYDRQIVMTCTYNYGDIYVGTAGGTYYGGLIGFTCLPTTLGEKENTAKACLNYGSIYCTNTATAKGMSYVGGLIGSLNNSATEATLGIYYGENYGIIGAKEGGTVGFGGGMVGSLGAEAELIGCIQHGVIWQGSNYLGGMIGNHTHFNLLIEDCSNGVAKEAGSGALHMYTPGGGRCGGMIGNLYGPTDLAAHKSEVNTVTILNSVNYGDISLDSTAASFSSLSGMVGRVDRMHLTLGDSADATKCCLNYGDIDSAVNALMDSAGGFVGLVTEYGPYDIAIYHGVNNGTFGAHMKQVRLSGGFIGNSVGGELKLYSCKQLGQIYHAKDRVGGLVGLNQYYNLVMDGCVNGSAEDEACGYIQMGVNPVDYVGGLIGASEANLEQNGEACKAVLTGCINYGTLYAVDAAVSVNNVGGLMGLSRYTTVIGEPEDAAKACYNYGTIDGTNKALFYQAGGFVGQVLAPTGAADSLSIYNGVNYGNIAQNAGALRHGGGILGYSVEQTTLIGCTNLGQMYHLMGQGSGNLGNGGIAGYIGSYVEGEVSRIENCVNGSAGDSEAGRLFGSNNENNVGGVGGIVGGIGNSANTEAILKGCVNYASMELKANSVNFIGGILGKQYTSKMVTLENVVNYGDIVCRNATATCIGGLVGQAENNNAHITIGGVLADGSTDTSKGCRNEGNIRLEETSYGRQVAGIAGQLYNASLYGVLQNGEIKPDEGSVVTSAAGQVSYLRGSSVMQDCIQMGTLNHVVYVNTVPNATAGGLVARADGSLKMLRCSNGSAESRTNGGNAGGIYAYRQNAKTGELVNIYRLGGLIGLNVASLTMEDCVNYADLEMVGIATNTGGIVGEAYTDNNANGYYPAVMKRCINYGDITCNENMSNVGGIVGSAAGGTSATSLLTMGEEADAAKACINYGAITVGGNTVSVGIGGLVGLSTRPIAIYDGVNEGNLGNFDREEGLLGSAGGIVGKLAAISSIPSKLIRCQEKGDMNRLTTAAMRTPNWAYQQDGGPGGIAGTIRCTTLIVDCVNGAPGVEQTMEFVNGAVSGGGIVGLAFCGANAKPIRIQNCINYKDMVGAGTLDCTGGIIGCGYYFVIGDETDEELGCVNYGNIYAAGKEIYLGGLLGYAGAGKIYNSINEGDVTSGKAGASFSGGIAGYMYDVDLKVVGNENRGNLLTAGALNDGVEIRGIGGIVGHFRFPNSSADIVRNIDISQVYLAENVNKGTIGVEGHSLKGIHIGGIVGEFNGTLENCTNLGAIYMGNSCVAGIVGYLSGEATRTLIKGCVNGSATDTEAGLIHTDEVMDKVAGIAGYIQTHNYADHLQIMNCINYADIELKAGQQNNYVAGIMGHVYCSGATAHLEILDCENYGNLYNGYTGVAGIYPIITSNSGQDYIIRCTNYGDIYGAGNYAGGICGTVGGYGGIMHCINVGNVYGAEYVGGITGYFGNATTTPYMIDCYQFGQVTGDYYGTLNVARAGGIVGWLGRPGEYVIDCYSNGAVVNGNAMIGRYNAGNGPEVNPPTWSAVDAGEGEGAFTESVYQQLCERFGVEAQWNAEDMVANAKYLISVYTYTPQDPGGSNFVYTAADPADSKSNNTISWNITAGGYVAVDAMELVLYPVSVVDTVDEESGEVTYRTLTEEEILADEAGALSYLTLKYDFTGTRIPDTISVIVPDEQLPMEATEYRLVLRNIGCSYVALDDSYQLILSQNSSRVLVEGETIVLPARPEELSVLGLSMFRPENLITDIAPEEEEETEGNVSAGDIESTDTVSNGNTVQ